MVRQDQWTLRQYHYKHYQSGKFNDKSYIVRSTGDNKSLSEFDKSDQYNFIN